MPTIVRMLLKYGADVNYINRCSTSMADRGTALHVALNMYGFTDMSIRADTTRQLVRAGADVNALDGDGATPLHILCNRMEGVSNRRSCMRPMQHALNKTCSSLLGLLVNSGSLRAVHDSYGDTPLSILLRKLPQPHVIEAISILLASGDVIVFKGPAKMYPEQRWVEEKFIRD